MGWNNVDMTPNRQQNLTRFNEARDVIKKSDEFFQTQVSTLDAARSNAVSLLSQVRSRYPAGSEAENQLNSSIAAITQCQEELPALQAHLKAVYTEFSKLRAQYDVPRNNRQAKLSGKVLSMMVRREAGNVFSNKENFELMVDAAFGMSLIAELNAQASLGRISSR